MKRPSWTTLDSTMSLSPRRGGTHSKGRTVRSVRRRMGYRPVFGATTPDDERAELNRIAARQETEPYLRFGVSDPNDPTVQTEDLGDGRHQGDDLWPQKPSCDHKETDPRRRRRARTTVHSARSTMKYGPEERELGHVANYVGGVIKTSKVAGQKGNVSYTGGSGEQKASMAYLRKEDSSRRQTFSCPKSSH